MNRKGDNSLWIIIIIIGLFLIAYYISTKTIDIVEEKTNQSLNVDKSEIGEGIAKDMTDFTKGISIGIIKGIFENKSHMNNLQISDSKNNKAIIANESINNTTFM